MMMVELIVLTANSWWYTEKTKYKWMSKSKANQSIFKSFTHLFLCSAQRSFSQFTEMRTKSQPKNGKTLSFFPTLRNFFYIHNGFLSIVVPFMCSVLRTCMLLKYVSVCLGVCVCVLWWWLDFNFSVRNFWRNR